MKFLMDEDVPLKLANALSSRGHDCVRVKPSSADLENAKRAKAEERLLITLDKDFTNISMYPPSQYNILIFQIHPPYADKIIEAMEKLLRALQPSEFKGLIIAEKSGHIRLAP